MKAKSNVLMGCLFRIMGRQWVLGLFVVLFLVPGSVWAGQRMGFIVNWTSKKLLVVIVPIDPREAEALVFRLEAVASMGKGNYEYRPPNTTKLYLDDGDYMVFYRYVLESQWKKGDINVNEMMPLPFEIDIEE